MRTCFNIFASTAVAFALAHPALSAGAPPHPQPWQLTPSERLTARFDPQQVAARRNAAEDAELLQGFVETIDGQRHPHLFLPHELFTGLATAFTSDMSLRAKQQAYYGAGVEAFGWNREEFWTALEEVSQTFVRLRYFTAPNTPVSDAALCRARYEALHAARERFGRAEFDRFLYTVVAPSQRQSTAADNPEMIRASLMRREAGCR